MASKSGLELTWQPTNRLDCVAWSADSEIAVACEEGVELFIPNLSINTTEFDSNKHESENWHKLRLQVNLFTSKELPLLAPAYVPIVSIGEEQSPGNVAEVAWSAPGLARYRRSALAVLTTNLVLSIWTYDGNPTIAESWKRVLIVNNFLSNSSNSATNSHASDFDENENENDRTTTRVRAFSWSQPLEHHYSSFKDTSSKKVINRDCFFIAVSNDSNEIIICQVYSPYSNLQQVEPGWSVRVMLRLDLSNLTTPLNGPPQESIFFSRDIAERLSWSPWVENQLADHVRYKSCLAFVVNAKVHVKECILEANLSHEAIKFTEGSLVLDSERCGIVRWTYHPLKSRTLVVSSAGSNFYLAEVQFNDHREGLDIQALHKSEALFSWNRVAGIAYGATKEQIFSHLALDHRGWENKPPCFSLTLSNNQVSTSYGLDGLSQQLQDHFATIAKRYPFGTTFKNWGVCSNINSDLLAIVVSSHPRDLIDYGVSADRECYLFIENTLECAPTQIFTASAESLFLSLSSFIRQQSRRSFSNVNNFDLFVKWASEIRGSPVATWELLQNISAFETVEQGVSYLRQIFSPYQLLIPRLHDKFQHTRGQLDAPKEPPAEIRSLLLLTFVISKFPYQLFDKTPLSRIVIEKYYQAQTALQGWIKYFENLLGVSYHYLTTDALGDAPHEYCGICGSVIQFQDVSWAQCDQGHQYVRCGLTLLAIQMPGCSKQCGLCGKRYFTEGHLLNDINIVDPVSARNETENAISPQWDKSLIEVLILGCNTCIFCGGKFNVA